MDYRCDNCQVGGEEEHCPCVFAACEWCLLCVALCRCAEPEDDSDRIGSGEQLHHLRPNTAMPTAKAADRSLSSSVASGKPRRSASSR